MIYGYNPLDGLGQQICKLKPVMTLKSIASTFRMLKVGDTVSYSGTWKAARETVIAVVPIGYADGYHRSLSNKGFALFNGFRVPVVGNVCMDYLMLDVTDAVKGCDLKSLKDKEVTLFGYASNGELLSADELAAKADSITWEVLTSVGERVPRVYVGSEATDV
jgi:alanine racemase